MPAKLYGQLVGAQVQALNSGLIGIVPPHCKDSFDLILARDFVVLNGALIGDVVSLGAFRSTAFLDTLNSYLLNDALGAGVICNVGDAVHPAGLASALNLAAAGWQGVGGISAALVAATLWQQVGYATDPGGQIELLATFAGANPAAGGGLAWQLFGRNL